MDEFIETTWLAVASALLSSIPRLYNSLRRKKETKIYVVVFLYNKEPYRKPVCGLIPEKQRINQSHRGLGLMHQMMPAFTFFSQSFSHTAS
jgi:hypothetical protein